MSKRREVVTGMGVITPIGIGVDEYWKGLVERRNGVNLISKFDASIFDTNGHLLGAAGGIEAVATILSIMNSIVPPTINLINPDPQCDLNYSPNISIKKEIRYAISNTFGFGGHNASLIFKRI